MIAFALLLHVALAEPRGDHLEPPYHVFGYQLADGYHRAVASALLSHRVRDVAMIVLPSFSPEYIARDERGIRGQRGASPPKVIVRRAQQSIWGLHGQAVQKRFPPGTRPTLADVEAVFASVLVKSDYFEAEIDEDTVVLLESVWNAALLETRYPSAQSSGLDGVRYFFADFTIGFGDRVGTTWTPDAGTKMATLADIGETLVAYARATEAQRATVHEALREKVRAAQRAFQVEQAK